MTDKPPRPPPARSATARSAIRAELETGLPCTAKDLASAASCSEKDVAAHLEHLAKTLKAAGERLAIDPAECLACGYVFRDRQRLTTPSACPECRSERVAPPSFRVDRPAG